MEDLSKESSCCRHHGGKHFIVVLVGLFLTAYLGTLTANNLKAYRNIGKPDSQIRSITVSGMGKVTATPTIAVTNVGLVTEKPDVASAQTENTAKMNAFIAAMKQVGIAEADIKTTQYQIYPKYSYDQKSGSNIIGYSVTQSVDVKIRDLTKISEVLAKAGSSGANQVSGIQFTIDDPKVIQSEARDKAVADARERAEKLATALGVKLGRVTGFGEDMGQGGPIPMPMFSKMYDGMGGGEAAPAIQSGTLDVTSNVSITYELE